MSELFTLMSIATSKEFCRGTKGQIGLQKPSSQEIARSYSSHMKAVVEEYVGYRNIQQHQAQQCWWLTQSVAHSDTGVNTNSWQACQQGDNVDSCSTSVVKQRQSLTQHVAAKVLFAKMGLLSGPTYSAGLQLPRVLLPNGFPQTTKTVAVTVSWLLLESLSGFVSVAVAVLSPAVDAVVGMVYALQTTTEQ